MAKKQLKPSKLAENQNLTFLGYRIVDEDGNVIGTDPSQFPELMKRCSEVVATIRTGKNYRVMEDGEK